MRRRDNGLVQNEKLLLVTALRLTNAGQSEFHGYALRELWHADGSEPATMNYATLYRCLDRLEQRGLLSHRYDVDGNGGGPPRKLFQLTGAGLDAAVGLDAPDASTNEGTLPRTS